MNIRPNAVPVDSREHAARLWRLIARELRSEESPLGDCDWNAVLIPLHVSSSIYEVEADTSFVDDTESVVYCRPAAEYESARSDLMSKYVRNLTVFVWTWIALEKAIDLVCPCSKGNRVHNAVKFITRHAKSAELWGMRDVANGTYEVVRNLMGDKIDRKIRLATNNGFWSPELNVLFIYVCREARNFFVHEAMIDFEPEDWGASSDYRIEPDKKLVAVNLLTHSTLFAIQLLLLASAVSCECTYRTNENSAGVPSDLLLQQVLQAIHLRPEDYSLRNGELPLEFRM